MINETVWWVVVSFSFLQEFCKKIKIKNSYRGVYEKGVKPTTPTTPMLENKTKQTVCPAIVAWSRQKPKIER